MNSIPRPMTGHSLLLLALFAMLLAAGCSKAREPTPQPGGSVPMRRDVSTSAPLEDHLFKPADILDRQAALSLTPAQRDDIVSDVRRTQAELVDVDARLRAQHERLGQLLEGTHVDAAEAARVAAELVRAEGQVKTLHLGLLVRIKNRLTPEQQAQLRGG